jgi:hypothetical protein
MQWQWRNDPDGLPDDDHARCIAAPGMRLLVYGTHLFKLTTLAGSHIHEPAGACVSRPRSALQMEYAGFGWANGSIARTWRSKPFDSGPLGTRAQHAAGLALMATVVIAMASR